MSDKNQASANGSSNHNGRDARGRFTAGNGGGPGNPFARRVAELRSELMDCVDRKDVAEIARALVDKAKKGDVPAAKLVLAYTLGKPAAAVLPDRLDIDEWQIYRDTQPMAAEMSDISMAGGPDLPLNVVRGARPIFSKDLAVKMRDMFWHPENCDDSDAQNEQAPSPFGPIGAALRDVVSASRLGRLDPDGFFADSNVVSPSPDGVTAALARRRRSGAAGAPAPLHLRRAWLRGDSNRKLFPIWAWLCK